MNEHSPVIETRPAAIAATPLRGRLNLLWLLAPLAVLGLAIAWLYSANPLSGFDNGAPPVESLTVERTILDQDGLRLLVRAGGSEPMSIAQVQVDAAYWQFTQDPAGPIARGDTAWISVPFPWVLGEAHHVTFVTETGATFEHEIAVAVPTPAVTSQNLVSQALLGAFVGILPVVVGLMFYPALRGAGQATMNFLLAMTIGLLGFLLVDTIVRGAGIRGRIGGDLPGAGDGRACRGGELPPPDGRGATAGSTDRTGARNLHRHRHRPAQSRRRPGDRRGLRGRLGRARHLPCDGLCAAQRHRGHRHRGPDPQGEAAALRRLRDWRCSPAARP